MRMAISSPGTRRPSTRWAARILRVRFCRAIICLPSGFTSLILPARDSASTPRDLSFDLPDRLCFRQNHLQHAAIEPDIDTVPVDAGGQSEQAAKRTVAAFDAQVILLLPLPGHLPHPL